MSMYFLSGRTCAAVTLGLLLVSFLFFSENSPAEEKLFIISSYTTSLQDQDLNVKTNIALAAERLNGQTIHPGSVFSFNTTVGEGSAANGYLTGRVLYQDMTAYEPGGGICQVSSTTFNSMLLAGFVIMERHRHARPVLYTPPGLDATIRYGKKDLRMKNPHPFPVIISTSINDKSLTVVLRSSVKPRYSYEIYTEEEEVNLPFASGDRRNVNPGLTVYVYRKRLSNNEFLENSLLYRDFYPPFILEN